MRYTLVAQAVCIRVLIALLTRTFFQPDEYFQSLEPAHAIVFGYGHLTWEWQAIRPIRSVIYPALNIPIYWILKVLSLDNKWPSLIINAPKLLHGVLAAATDVWVCELATEVIGQKYVSTVFFLSITSFFHTLSLSRSLSNSLETSLTTIALAYFPWDSFTRPFASSDIPGLRVSIIFAGLACCIRITNAIIWVYMFTALVWHLRSQTRALAAMIWNLALSGTLILCGAFGLDSLYYSEPTFTPFNFLLTNLSSVSLFYGSNPWHYYIFQALPILCTTCLPFVLHGVWLAATRRSTNASDQKQKVLLGCLAWTIGVYSAAGHKEWRFLHPLLPILHVFAAKSLVDASKTNHKAENTAPSGPRSKPLVPIQPRYMWLIFATVPASLYVMLFHCSSQISVMSYLRTVPPDEMVSLGFLMPCHSTPWQAYLHRPDLVEHGTLWALGCEPPLGNQNLTTYMDQTDMFYQSPIRYIQNHFPPHVSTKFPPSPLPSSPPGTIVQVVDGIGPWKHEWPKNLVMFGVLLDDLEIRMLLESKGYYEVWHAGWKWEGEGKRSGGVKVWKHPGQKA